MFQAALLAFKNKKDNEQIENGVLNNNGSSSSYFTKSAPNLNNYENDDVDSIVMVVASSETSVWFLRELGHFCMLK